MASKTRPAPEYDNSQQVLDIRRYFNDTPIKHKRSAACGFTRLGHHLHMHVCCLFCPTMQGLIREQAWCLNLWQDAN